MLKYKRNNKGFTLIELIIAMSIFSVVIFMGYKVINGSNKVSIAQAEISKEQQNANLLNKYLTKDLEVSKSIEPFGINDDGNINNSKNLDDKYGYDIKINKEGTDQIVKYEVYINDVNKDYSIDRKENNESINIISNQKYDSSKSKLPFIISKDEVRILMGDNNYNFKVNSRIQMANTDSTDPPDGGNDEYKCGVIVDGRKITQEEKVEISRKSCDHLNEGENKVVLEIDTKHLKDGIMEIDFNNKIIEMSGKHLSKHMTEELISLCPKPNKVLDENGREIIVKANGKVVIDDIHVNPGVGKQSYEIKW